MDDGRGRRQWRRRRPLSMAIVAAAVLTTSAPALADEPAQEAAATGALTIETVLSTHHRPGDHVVLRVVVTADRLLDGHVTVTADGSDLAIRREVEVAGGASKELLLLVPTSEATVPRLAAVLVDDDTEVADGSVRLTRDAGTDVAGVLPGIVAALGELPRRTTLPATDRRVELAAVTPEIFDLGPSALDQLDSVVATSADLTALTPAARSVLLGWLAAGGRLLVDDADDLSALPAPWQPSAAGYALAGAGEVRLVGGAARAGRWPDVLDAAPAADDLGRGFDEVFVPPEVTLGQRAGVRLPDLDVLVLLLVGYVLAVGPIAYLVLRRLRRLTLAWVVLPGLAVVTAVAVIVAGSAWRSSGRPTANLAVEVHPGGATAWADVLLLNRSGGVTALALPAGWTVDEQQVDFFGSPDAVGRTAVIDDRATTIEATLEAGQIVVLNATGPFVASDIEVVATAAAGGDVTGTVRNPGAETLSSVAVLAGGCGTSVGELAPGATASYTLECGLGDRGGSAAQVWSDPSIGIGFGPASPGVDLGLWTSFSIARGASLYPPGTVRVAGWVDGTSTELRAGDPLVARSLVTTVVPITTEPDAAVPPIAVRSSVVQYPFDPRSGQVDDGIYRFVVPPTGLARTYRVELPAELDDPEVWTSAGEWTPIDTGSGDVVVPAEAVRTGVVLLRVASSPELAVDPTRTPTIESLDG